MKRLTLSLALAVHLQAAEPIKPDHHFAWSLVAVAGSQTLDIVSSRGLYEQNPILGRGPFGARQAGIKVALVAPWPFVEWIASRHRPALRRLFTVSNYAEAGTTGAVAIHNFSLK